METVLKLKYSSFESSWWAFSWQRQNLCWLSLGLTTDWRVVPSKWFVSLMSTATATQRVSRKQLRARSENVCSSEQHLFLVWYVLVRFDDDLPDVAGRVVVRRGREPGPVEGRRDHTSLPHQLLIFQPHTGSLEKTDKTCNLDFDKFLTRGGIFPTSVK